MALANDAPLFKAYVLALRRALMPTGMFEPVAEVATVERQSAFPPADAMPKPRRVQADLPAERRA